ncbi:MAG: Ig-like domain-containing protein, partial [Lysinibacillus sp.]
MNLVKKTGSLFLVLTLVTGSLSIKPTSIVYAASPTATIIVSDTALRIGETSLVTITFSEAVTDFSNADLSIANGTLSVVSSSDGGITWTATFTPASNVTDMTNLISLDNTGIQSVSSGNAGSGTTNSNNYAIDTQGPTATIVVADTALRIGETSLVTIT